MSVLHKRHNYADANDANSVYWAPGTYIGKLVCVTHRESKNPSNVGAVFYIPQIKVLLREVVHDADAEHGHLGSLKVGEVASHVINITSPYSAGDIKSFSTAILDRAKADLDVDEAAIVADEENKPDGDVLGLIGDIALENGGQRFRGILVRVVATPTTTKNGKPFTRVRYLSVTDEEIEAAASPAADGLDDF